MLVRFEKNAILILVDSIYTDNHLNIILEYVENGSLESLIKKFSKLGEPLVAIYIQ